MSRRWISASEMSSLRALRCPSMFWWDPHDVEEEEDKEEEEEESEERLRLRDVCCALGGGEGVPRGEGEIDWDLGFRSAGADDSTGSTRPAVMSSVGMVHREGAAGAGGCCETAEADLSGNDIDRSEIRYCSGSEGAP